MAKKDKVNASVDGQVENQGKGLSKDIDMDAIKEKLSNLGKKKSGLPSKTSMNLAFKEKGENTRNQNIALIVVTALVLIVLAKFGVYDVYQEKKDEIAKRDEAQAQLDADNALLAKYADLQDKYSHYFYAFLTDDELAIVNRVELFHMLEENLFNVAGMQSVNVKGNVVSIAFDGVTLEQVGTLAENLEANEMVENVDVSTTASEQNGTGQEKLLKANITIQIKNAWLNSESETEGGES